MTIAIVGRAMTLERTIKKRKNEIMPQMTILRNNFTMSNREKCYRNWGVP